MIEIKPFDLRQSCAGRILLTLIIGGVSLATDPDDPNNRSLVLYTVAPGLCLALWFLPAVIAVAIAREFALNTEASANQAAHVREIGNVH